MATAPTSYLQTLTNDEAIAFIASLQSVRVYLNQELHWINEQVQQKTAQLQGIETLLSEASALGLLTVDPHASEEDISAEDTSTAASTAPVITTPEVTQESALETLTKDGITSSVTVEEPVDAVAALPIENRSQPHDRPGEAKTAKAANSSKAPVATKTKAAKAKQPQRSASRGNQRGKTSNLQRFLKSQWRDKALTESVSDILGRAAAPLSTDEVMAALYDGLPQADYDRAKHSLANILSVGRSKGTWKSTGRGRYAGN